MSKPRAKAKVEKSEEPVEPVEPVDDENAEIPDETDEQIAAREAREEQIAERRRAGNEATTVDGSESSNPPEGEDGL